MKNSPLKPFTILSETITYQEPNRLSIIKSNLLTPTGKQTTWTYTRTKDAAIILPLDQKGNVYLKKEWRLNRKDFIWEIPGGIVEQENPTPTEITETANRELQEEIGLKSNQLTHLTSFYPTNHTTAHFHIFLAQKLTKSKLPQDEHEHLETQKLPFPEAFKLVTQTQTPTAQVLLAFLLTEKHLL